MTGLKVSKLDETKSMLGFEELSTGNNFCLMKDDFNRALHHFKLWRRDLYATNFHSEFFRLVCHADDFNKQKLLKGFPAEMIVYLLWYTSTSEDDFYKEWGDIKNEEPKDRGVNKDDE